MSLTTGADPGEGHWPHQNHSQMILGTLSRGNLQGGTLLKLGSGKSEAAEGSQERIFCLILKYLKRKLLFGI